MTGDDGAAGASWRPDARFLDGLGVAALAVDVRGGVSYANTAAESLFGRASAGMQDQDLRSLLAEDADRGVVTGLLQHVLSGEGWTGELAMRDASSRRREMETTWSPVRAGAEVVGALLLVQDASPAPGAESRTLSGRLHKLAAVTAELVAAADLDEVTRVVTENLAGAAGATVGSLSLLLDETTLAMRGLYGGREGAASRWATYPVAGNTPAAETVRNGHPLVLVGSAEIARRYPGLETGAPGERSITCLPLRVAGRTTGVVGLAFPGRRELDTAELRFLTLLADICAQAIERIRAVNAAEDREAKLRFLAEASVELASDLDHEATLRRVAEMAVPWFADWCTIALEEGGRLRTLSVAHSSPQHGALVEDLQTRYPASPDASRGSYQVLRTGTSELYPEIPDELLAASAQDVEHLAMLRALNFRSALVVALVVQGRPIGVITWVAGEDGRRFGPADLAFAEDLARRAAAAIDTSQLHSQLRDVALRLRRAALPDQLPIVVGWESAVRHLPAGRGGAGGDFYDLLPLDDGRVAVFVGDVMGHGVQAVEVMAQLRASVRTLIAVDPAPDAVMRGLDRVFTLWRLEPLVTLLYAVADPAAGTISVINAGHPAPLLRPASGPARWVPARDPLLLGVDGGVRTVVIEPFGPGDCLLLFTDGLVERRDENLDTGLGRVLEVADELHGADLGAALVRVVDAVRELRRDDDVLALALRRGPAPAVS
ncbi:MAG: SpoIIE family protein phosphatase [Nocardioides sp.]|nr:SpoIIE family protein phosphatase [Nocardioides sp.]